MPRGRNPNSLKALAENRKSFTSETARKANAKSTQAKRQYADLKEALKDKVEPEEVADVFKRRLLNGNYQFMNLYVEMMGLKDKRVEISGTKVVIVDDCDQ